MTSNGTGHEAWDPINDPAVSQDATGWFREHRGHCPDYRVAGDVEWAGGVNNRPVALNLAW